MKNRGKSGGIAIALPALLITCGSVLSMAGEARAQSSVSPSDRSVYEGSGSTFYPLGRANARVQTLHADLNPGLTQISGHAYRRDGISTRGLVPGFTAELSVELSMSPRTADQPSNQFSENMGSQPSLVLPRTRLVFPDTSRPERAPSSEFAMLIPYDTPFMLPSGGGTICLDIKMFGNSGPSGQNVNFSPLLDSHAQFRDQRAEQPGFRYGSGCAASGNNSSHYGNYTLTRRLDGFELEVSSRFGIPDDGSVGAITVAFFGQELLPSPLPWLPDCSLMASPQNIFLLPGGNDSRGHLDAEIAGAFPLPTGFPLTAQLASASLSGELTLSDASSLIVPPLGPATIPSSRIANSSDRDAVTGSTSLTVPVTLFY
ncbi:MAG: hypothetical protein ACYTG5_05795 [Planctomycetota bacterium]|jgi:hypothetical protein